MKHPYVGLWMLLASSLIVFTCLSAIDNLEINGFELKKASIYEELNKPTNSNIAKVDSSLVLKNSIAIKKDEIKMDSLKKNILFIGDSMLEGLSPRMAAYCEKNGHTLHSVIWYSSTSETWGKCDTLRHFIRKFKPDYIFISLGANELFVKDIKKKRNKYVDHILSQVGKIPYVWIGPPNWKDDSGINELVASKTQLGSFFLTNGMKFDRAKDGAHPTRSSAVLWMDSVARWIKIKGNHPILLDYPDKNTTRAKSTTILQPQH